MGLLETVVNGLLNVTVVALLSWTTWTAFQRWERPNARPFVALLGALTAWALILLGATLTAIFLGSGIGDTVASASFLPALIVPGTWTWYVLGYAGRGTGLTRRRILMLSGSILPVVLAGAALAVVALDPPESEGSLVLLVLLSMLAAAVVSLFGLLVYAAYILIRLGWRYTLISNVQVAVLLLGISAPYLGGVIGTNSQVADGMTVGLLLSGGLFFIAVRRYPVLTGVPSSESVARKRVVESLREAVVVFDWDEHVVDANESVAQVFDRSRDAIVGEPLRSVVDGTGSADLSAGATGTVTVKTTRGRRQLQYSVSAVDAPGDDDQERDPVARAVVFRDVTERRTQEQRLAVLNRILRHNVRNRLDVVLANADRIDDDTLRTDIRDNATELVELSKKAREAERLMENRTESPEPLNLVTIGRDIVEQYRAADSETELTLSCPDELSIYSYPAIIRRLLSELVDNAISHNTESTPYVEITVRSCDESTAEILVADNGPGIPERERAVLTEGTETQLKHGRGIGLWTVQWAVRQLGGGIAFEENNPDGSIVTVRLPDVEYASRREGRDRYAGR
ncbi:ATP-binding protein [Halorientalis sp.]|uniref:ATP-binding protein n=1 Tax=Halorientalis sp. TaxID=1931229 RepID=UPI0026259BE2|nr:ATP-binding protein [Halorientalis sp.]